jgi:capsular exopolysaccharide synthesis family protein
MLEEAVIVQAPNPAKQALQTVVPALGALLLILLAGTWLEYQSGRVSSTTEVAQRLGNVVVATVPKVTDRARLRLKPPRSGHDLREHNILADAVDMARALLLGTGTGSGPKVVMVTSAKPGEGKTSLAVQLALSLARSGRATLLIDADFRCPNLHSVFGLPVGPGLGEILQGKSEPSDAIQRQEGLSVITAGQCDVRTVLGLVQIQLPQVLETLRRRFDYIVLDAAPVLDLPDTILLGLNADGTILSTLRDVSRLPLMQSALERLSVLNIPVLGAVLNGAPISSDYDMARRRRADPLRYV